MSTTRKSVGRWFTSVAAALTLGALTVSGPASAGATKAQTAQKRIPVGAPTQNSKPQSIVDTADGPIPSDGLGLQVAPQGLGIGSMFVGQGYTAVVTGTGVSKTPAGVPGPKFRRYYAVTINPGTGYVESFIVQPAHVPLTTPAPLLMVFHKYGNSEKDITINTGFVKQAIKKNWYLVAPLSAAQIHFSSIESQFNTNAVFEWVFAHFAIDRTRIYGAGFSMGGGAVMNYAARHVDPAQAMFAAVIDHTGTVDLNNANLKDAGLHVWPYPLDYWFGTNWTPGSADPWKMARSSVIRFDDVTLAVDTDQDLASNLTHVAIRIVRATNDPLTYLTRQCDVLDAHLRNALGFVPGPNYAYDFVPGSTHNWNTLDYAEVCDWLGQHTLTLPTQASTLADHDGVYFNFTVAQDATGAFTPFDWVIDSGTNTLSITLTKNLKSIALDTATAGLSVAAPLTLNLASADGLADEVRLGGWTTIPSSVTRDGLPEVSWSHDSLTGVLTVTEYDAAAHSWVFTP